LPAFLNGLPDLSIAAAHAALQARRRPPLPPWRLTNRAQGSWTSRDPAGGIGASAGGVKALTAIAKGLPRDFPAALVVVLHVGGRRSVLPDILTGGPLPAALARRKESGADRICADL